MIFFLDFKLETRDISSPAIFRGMYGSKKRPRNNFIIIVSSHCGDEAQVVSIFRSLLCEKPLHGDQKRNFVEGEVFCRTLVRNQQQQARSFEIMQACLFV